MQKKGFPYIPHTEEDVKDMLRAIGKDSMEDLLSVFPKDLRCDELNIPSGLSEQELLDLAKKITFTNKGTGKYSSFLGAGSYNHYSPSLVNHILLRSEFFTAYTPYQPEVSQGTLQTIFEYQTLICQLTGMEVSNASLYDGASGVAEAVLMAERVTKRDKVVLSSALHPEYRDTTKTYHLFKEGDIVEAPYSKDTGATEGLVDLIDDKTAAVVIQYPNFFGTIEDLEKIAKLAHDKGALFIVAVTEPVALGLLTPPGEFGADIVVGEAQSFGAGLSYGGPYLGFLATQNKHLRQMPGRVAGQTVDRNGTKCFCLTLSTREQHIRREKATSNICTNQGLISLAATVHLTALGKSGLISLANVNLSKAHYLKDELEKISGVKAPFSNNGSPFFNEFTVDLGRDTDEIMAKLMEREIIGGLPLKRFYPELNTHMLLAVTEMNSVRKIDLFINAMKEILN